LDGNFSGIIATIMTQSTDGHTEEAAQSYPELFIGLVAAVGTDHTQLCSVIEETLRSFQYRCKTVRLASLLHTIPQFKDLPSEPVDLYIERHQKAGNDFRKIIGREDALAALGISEVQDLRSHESGAKDKIANRCAYIIRSLKTPEEVQLLRDIYGNAFVLVACSAHYHIRRRYLAERIAQSRHEFHPDPFLAKAEELIQADQQERDNKFGQNLKNAFHRADVFVDSSDAKTLRKSIERFFDLVFGILFTLRAVTNMRCFRRLALGSDRPSWVDRLEPRSRLGMVTSSLWEPMRYQKREAAYIGREMSLTIVSS